MHKQGRCRKCLGGLNVEQGRTENDGVAFGSADDWSVQDGSDAVGGMVTFG